MTAQKKAELRIETETLEKFGIQSKVHIFDDNSFSIIVHSKQAAYKLFEVFAGDKEVKLSKHPSRSTYFLIVEEIE